MAKSSATKKTTGGKSTKPAAGGKKSKTAPQDVAEDIYEEDEEDDEDLEDDDDGDEEDEDEDDDSDDGDFDTPSQPKGIEASNLTKSGPGTPYLVIARKADDGGVMSIYPRIERGKCIGRGFVKTYVAQPSVKLRLESSFEEDLVAEKFPWEKTTESYVNGCYTVDGEMPEIEDAEGIIAAFEKMLTKIETLLKKQFTDYEFRPIEDVMADLKKMPVKHGGGASLLTNSLIGA